MPDDRTPPEDARMPPDESNRTTSDDEVRTEQTHSAQSVPREDVTAEAPAALEVESGDAPSTDPGSGPVVAAKEPVIADTIRPRTSDSTTPNGATPPAADATASAHTEPATSDASAAVGAKTASEHAETREPMAAGDKAGTAPKEPSATSEVDSAEATPAEGDFEKLLDASETKLRTVKVGDRVRGKIVSIGEEHCFVDYQGRAEARIATSELRDRDGTVVMRVDDMITATVAAADDNVTLTLGKRRGPVNAARLRVAFESKVPISGTVKSINKGGFDVNVGGIRAFCPLSQIDNSFVEDPKEYVGQTFSFRVLRWENGGRNIVVSRRPILREESKQHATETRKKLAEGAEFEGVVTRLQPFGAFIDLGGLEGLLHVSRMGHTRVANPSAVVSRGDKVKVRVVSIENPGTRKERIALSLVDLGPDPWELVREQIKDGDVLSGTVARLVPFGAFVRLPNGMDGLAHVSELSDKHIQEPSEAVSQGQEVQVRVLHVDVEKKRISLSLRLNAEPVQTSKKPRREPRAPRGAPKEPKTPSNAGGPVSLTHTMADQLGQLKDKLRDQS